VGRREETVRLTLFFDVQSSSTSIEHASIGIDMQMQEYACKVTRVYIILYTIDEKKHVYGVIEVLVPHNVFANMQAICKDIPTLK
jgi:hypothetical protein